MVKLRSRLMASPASRRMREQRAWKVPAVTCSAMGPPRSLASRSRSSRAALLVKVSTQMPRGPTPTVRTRYATRCTMTRVLPLPGPATMSSGPSMCCTACCCAWLRPSRRLSVVIRSQYSSGGGGRVRADGRLWAGLRALRRRPAVLCCLPERVRMSELEIGGITLDSTFWDVALLVVAFLFFVLLSYRCSTSFSTASRTA